MKKVVFLLLVIVLLVLPVAAYAGKPYEEVDGYFYYDPTGCLDWRFAGKNYIGHDCHDTGEYGTGRDGVTTKGVFFGDSTEVYDLTLHDADEGAGPPLYDYKGKAWYKGIVTFVGTVGSSGEGTMRIKYIGKSSPADPTDWTGTWRILHGAEGGLEGIHGGGTWKSDPDPNFSAHIEGKIHFN